MDAPKFGGPWTEKKLNALEKYLSAYLEIFTKNPKAAKFTRHYVDAFAGSGLRSLRGGSTATLVDLKLQEAAEYADGSTRKVLSMDGEFHKYLFVEKNFKRAASLEQMIKEDFLVRSAQCEVFKKDANEFLVEWADQLGPMDRAVVFLDPFGMDVKWTMIQKLAGTKKVDLWMLVPSSGIIRMLPKKGPPEEAWARRLTELFGDKDWLEKFYKEVKQNNLFEKDKVSIKRKVTQKDVSNYLLHKLKEIFSGVVDKPLILQNSRNSTLFMLVFAAGNPNGAKTAIKIAGDIIKNT